MKNLPKMDMPLTLEAAAVARDAGGGDMVVWTPVAVLWGALKAISAREVPAGGAMVSSVTHRVQMRMLPRESICWPSPAHRLRLDNRVFAIEGVTEASDMLLTLWVRETVAP